MGEVVGAVVVTYRPDLAATALLFDALLPQVDHVVVVDNGSPSTTVTALADQLAGHADVDPDLVSLPDNRGIAEAQNIGIERVRARGATAVLLSDQDSIPAPDMVERLVEGLERARRKGARVAAVGPVTLDERDAGATLLFEARRWGPRRATLPRERGELVPVVFLIASGCLLTPEALDVVGPMNAAWFIDHIDLEWGLRAGRAGFSMFGVTGAHLGHHLGDRMIRMPGRRRGIHIHSPVRNYYMTRNTLLLIRSGLLSPAWRLGYLLWIVKYAGFYVAVEAPRLARAQLIARGAWDGLRGRSGALR